MKTYCKMFSILSAALFMPSLASADTVCDTVLNVADPHVVTIVESPKGLEVAVRGSGSDSTLVAGYEVAYNPDAEVVTHQSIGSSWNPFKQDQQSRWFLRMCLPSIGFVGAPGAPSGLGQEWSKSLEIFVPEILGIHYSPLANGSSLSLSWGMSWRNYRITTPTRFILENDKVGYGAYPEGANPRYSRLKVFSWAFPLVWHQKLPFHSIGSRKSCWVDLGAVFNYNKYASLKTDWVDNQGVKCRDFSKNIGQRKFSVDAYASFSPIHSVAIYARWSPQSVLSNGSLDFNTFTLGLSFGF